MATKQAPYTMTEAGNRAAAKVGHSNEVNGCLAECVNPAYHSPYSIPAPWGWGGNGRPWAINYWLNAVAHGKVVKTSNPADVPYGALGFMINVSDIGRAKPLGAGHVFIGAGKSLAYSTDRPKNGKWGKVTIKSIEAAWGKRLVGYILVTGDGYVLTDKTPAPKPPTKAYEPVDFVYQNVAGYNSAGLPGVTGYKEHIPSIAAKVIAEKPDIFAVVELSNKAKPKMLPLMDSSLKGHLTRVPQGTDGRYLYNAPTIEIVARGHFTAKASSWFGKDDKQAAWEVFKKNGTLGATMTYQLAYEDGHVADGKRVAQALDFLAQFEAKMHQHGVDPDNGVIVGDTNSEAMVCEAMVHAGWEAVGLSVDTDTFNGWGHGQGTRIDWVFRRTGGKATGYKVVISHDSDHNRIRFTFHLIK